MKRVLVAIMATILGVVILVGVVLADKPVGNTKGAIVLPTVVSGSIAGTVDIQGHTDESGAFVMASGGYLATTDATGSYSLMLPVGTYTVTAAHPKSLWATRYGVVVSDSVTTTLPSALILIGDGNGDGEIGLQDLVLVGLNWRATVPPGNPYADFNDDGVVNLVDLVAVGINYGQTAPTTW